MRSGIDTEITERDTRLELQKDAVGLIQKFIEQAVRIGTQYVALKNLDMLDDVLIKKSMKIACIWFHANPPSEISSADGAFDRKTGQVDKELVILNAIQAVENDEDFDPDNEYCADLIFSVENADSIFDEWKPDDELGIFLKSTLELSMRQADEAVAASAS